MKLNGLVIYKCRLCKKHFDVKYNDAELRKRYDNNDTKLLTAYHLCHLSNKKSNTSVMAVGDLIGLLLEND
jgi:hypothetical protein